MKIEYIKSGYSSCLAINDTRITNEKLWGIGYTADVFDVDEDLLKDENEFEVYEHELFLNGEPTQGKVSKRELEKHIDEIERRRKRFLKDSVHRHNWKLCMREKWTVSKDKIKEII